MSKSSLTVVRLTNNYDAILLRINVEIVMNMPKKGEHVAADKTLNNVNHFLLNIDFDMEFSIRTYILARIKASPLLSAEKAEGQTVFDKE